MATAAIFFEPDGYVLAGPKLMGRQAAGSAFLRAAVSGRAGEPLFAYTARRSSAELFGRLVAELDPTAPAQWVPADRLDLLARIGTLYLPGPGLDEAAYLRLRAGAAAYSIVGVTHTTASHAAMDAIAGLLTAPVMPWDALICTSAAVAKTVEVVLQAELEYLRWRLGGSPAPPLPQFPVIPLGVHCGDFDFSAAERAAARAALGLTQDEVVFLFVGRLSFHAKAHPHAMYLGLAEASRRTGRKIALIQCGWFANEAIQKAFVEGAARFCPEVRALFTDGRDGEARRRSWAAADVFVSLSDNIQETFGLTPIEAMAAGLPAVVTDWDGYKETVRDGVDGFRIPTWMAPPNLGETLALAHEAGTENYDFYCGLACELASVDAEVLAERLASLAADGELRRRLGEAGRKRAREVFDWAVIYRRYRELWERLGETRRQATGDAAQTARLNGAPRCAPARLDPFRSFGHYPTRLIGPDTRAAAAPGADRAAYEALARDALYSYAVRVLPPAETAGRILGVLADGPLKLEELAPKAGLDLGAAVLAAAVLAKMGLLSLKKGSDLFIPS